MLILQTTARVNQSLSQSMLDERPGHQYTSQRSLMVISGNDFSLAWQEKAFEAQINALCTFKHRLHNHIHIFL